MADVWVYVLLSVFAVSLISLVGVITLLLRENQLRQILIYLVSFSAGGLLGNAFIHLLPNAVEKTGFGLDVSLYVLAGIVTYFVIEKFIRWRHCHIPTTKSHPHPFSFMILFGDGVHNFIDGLVIGASYLVDIQMGIATTMAVAFHEIPQEIGDFGSLLYGGFSKSKALLFNFLSAATALFGAAAILALGSYAEGATMFLVPFAAGGFIYIAGTDLIPQLHKEVEVKISAVQLIAFMIGISAMLGLILLE
jgi:zinc and cadmium transporter